MRVGLVIYGSLDTVTGGYLYDRAIVEHLTARGDSVDIISLPRRSYFSSIIEGIARRPAGDTAAGGWDVLLEDELCHPSLAFGIRSPAGARCPVVSIVHHLRCCEAPRSAMGRLYRTVERRYLSTVDGFIFNSETTRGEVGRLVGDGIDGVVAYPGRDRYATAVSERDVARRAHEGDRLRLLYLGIVVPRKGLHLLVEALGRMPGGRWELAVVGDLAPDPGYVGAVRGRMKALDLEGRIELCGLLDDGAVAERLRGSHVLVLPSLYEGFGIVHVEAMSAGLAVIGSPRGAASEIIRHGREGLLIEPGDGDKWARCIEMLAADRSLLAGLGIKALKRSSDFPTWEESAAAIRSYLRSFIDR